MAKAIAYYRTRPSEPEASDLALRLQRDAARRLFEGGGFELVGEFTEREGEGGDETYPAYIAAVRAALAHAEQNGSSVQLIVASHAAIGSGGVFQEPRVEGGGPLQFLLYAPLVPTPPEIALPPGAPGPLCLYADCRPGQLDTLVYLCNAGADALVDVAVASDTIDMSRFYTSEPGERWAEVDCTRERRWDVVAPGRCVLVDSLSHVMWDMVNRHRLTFADVEGRRRTAEAHDLPLNACRLSQDPDLVWVAFGPARAADRPAPERRTEEAP